MRELIQGRVYFTVSFLETKLVYPIVDAFVYVGMNLSDDDKEDTWYLQDTASFAEHGSFTDARLSNARVMTFTASRLGDVLDVVGLADLLTRSAAGRLTDI